MVANILYVICGEGALHGVSHEAELKLICDEFSIPPSKPNGPTPHLLYVFNHSLPFDLMANSDCLLTVGGRTAELLCYRV